MNCKNCGHIVNGKFCSHYGQDSNVRRINFANFLYDVVEHVFQVNKGFFYPERLINKTRRRAKGISTREKKNSF